MQAKENLYKPAKRYLIISASDNVAVALSDIEKKEILKINNKNISIQEFIQKGHKFSISKIQKEQNIIKFGSPIGIAIDNIEIGQWVHTHNLKSNLENITNKFDVIQNTKQNISLTDQKFMGFRRADGKIGIRNEIWIFPTVGCVSSLASRLANSFENGEVHAFVHQFGCSQLGDDLENTKSIIASLACHPNSIGVLIIGLGCENNRLAKLLEAIPKEYHYKIKNYEAQKVDDEFEYGKNLIKEIISQNKTQTREEINLKELNIGVKCGGSDGFSGLSANPLIGRISDYFTQIGGKVIMTEIPEVFGAEQNLYSRCENLSIYEKLKNTIENFKNYFTENGQKIYENPSPGNKDGGISTLEEKSLGAVQKSGNSTITDVLQYGQVAEKTGLNVLNAPGNDAISSTALAASGAHIILFSTGRGTPLGFPVPTLKISSNSAIAKNKPHWIDFDAGKLMEDGDFESLEKQLISKIIAIANGEETKNEIAQIRDIAIWKNGVTL